MDRSEGSARPIARRVALGIAGSLALAGSARPGAAEADWPVRTVRYIDPFPVSGATDLLSRLFCAKMSELSGQRFAVENLPGAAGTATEIDPEGRVGSYAAFGTSVTSKPRLLRRWTSLAAERLRVIWSR